MAKNCSLSVRGEPRAGAAGGTDIDHGSELGIVAHLPVPAIHAQLDVNGTFTVRSVSRALLDWGVAGTAASLPGSSLEVLLPDEHVLAAIRTAADRDSGPSDTVEARLRTAQGLFQVIVRVGSAPQTDGCPGQACPFCLPQRSVLLVLEPPSGHEVASTGRSLRGSEKRLQDMADNVTALMYLKRADGRYSFINHHYEERLGITRDKTIGKTDFDLWPAPIASTYRAGDNAVKKSRRAMEFEEPIPGIDGGWGMWLSLKFPIFDPDGTLYGVGGISTDISERNRAEALVREARDEAERANRAKSEFLSRMSHELRTPMNSILGFSQLLQREPLPGDAAVLVDRITGAGAHLLSLINEVLDLSRIEAGEQRFSLEAVDVCAPISEAIELVRPIAIEREIDIARDFHGGLGSFVLADHRRLKQVILNLLVNAVKYNRAGGFVTVSTETDARRVRIRVMDTGWGMDPEDVDRIFLPFERLSSPETAASTEDGTGLGLGLARSMVSLMGGALGVERTVRGRGSVFFLDMPLTDKPMTPPQLPADTTLGASAGEVDLGRCRILYIEDNLSNVELVRRVLVGAGDPELLSATNGRHGIELAYSELPDVILLDLHLPDIDGDIVLRQLRADQRTRDIPVVIMSADAVPAQEERLRRAGAAAYVTKPFDIETFLAELSHLVTRGSS